MQAVRPAIDHPDRYAAKHSVVVPTGAQEVQEIPGAFEQEIRGQEYSSFQEVSPELLAPVQNSWTSSAS
jgi:hypothetical protein